jgi:hypothetical protein
MPGSDGNIGKRLAFDVTSLKELWSLQQRAPFLDVSRLNSGRASRFVGDLDSLVQGGGRAHGQDPVADEALDIGAGLTPSRSPSTEASTCGDDGPRGGSPRLVPVHARAGDQVPTTGSGACTCSALPDKR